MVIVNITVTIYWVFRVWLEISTLLKPHLILITILAKPSFSRVPVLVQLVQLLGHVRPFATPWTAAHQASLSITNSRSLLKLLSIKSVMPSSHLILCHPLLLLPSIFPSIRVFSNESVLHITWPKYWSFSYSIRTSSEYSGLISLQSKGHSRVFSSTTAQKHQFFSAQPSLWSNSHIHTWLIEKIKALIIRKFVGKLMSLLFDTLSTFVIPFHPRSKYLLISWL